MTCTLLIRTNFRLRFVLPLITGEMPLFQPSSSHHQLIYTRFPTIRQFQLINVYHHPVVGDVKSTDSKDETKTEIISVFKYVRVILPRRIRSESLVIKSYQSVIDPPRDHKSIRFYYFFLSFPPIYAFQFLSYHIV